MTYTDQERQFADQLVDLAGRNVLYPVHVVMVEGDIFWVTFQGLPAYINAVEIMYLDGPDDNPAITYDPNVSEEVTLTASELLDMWYMPGDIEELINQAVEENEY